MFSVQCAQRLSSIQFIEKTKYLNKSPSVTIIAPCWGKTVQTVGVRLFQRQCEWTDFDFLLPAPPKYPRHRAEFAHNHYEGLITALRSHRGNISGIVHAFKTVIGGKQKMIYVRSLVYINSYCIQNSTTHEHLRQQIANRIHVIGEYCTRRHAIYRE